MELLGDVGLVELDSVRLEIVLISTQHQCTVWDEFTIGSKIILEIVLISMQDMCMVCVECANGSEIVLGIPDGTPR
jgi:hypothetical protein